MNEQTKNNELTTDDVVESAVGWLRDATGLLAELLERQGDTAKETLSEVAEINLSFDSGEYVRFFGIIPNADGQGASLTAKTTTAATVLAVLNFIVNELDFTEPETKNQTKGV